MKNINIKTVVDNTKALNPFKIKLENDNGKFWFAVHNETDNTCSTPYGSLTRDQLIELKNNINKLLKA